MKNKRERENYVKKGEKRMSSAKARKMMKSKG